MSIVDPRVRPYGLISQLGIDESWRLAVNMHSPPRCQNRAHPGKGVDQSTPRDNRAWWEEVPYRAYTGCQNGARLANATAV